MLSLFSPLLLLALGLMLELRSPLALKLARNWSCDSKLNGSSAYLVLSHD
jgi:hypothetical protein